MKSRKLALFLSFIYCGLGQIYRGQIIKGINFVIIYTILIALALLPTPMLNIIGITALPIMWVIGMVDAYRLDPILLDRKQWALAILPGLFLSAILLYVQIVPMFGKVIYVSIDTGDNRNPGTKKAPMKNIDQAIIAAKSGGILLVAEGRYTGTFDAGYLIINNPIKMYGGYSTDFSERDVIGHPTLFQPGPKIGTAPGKALITMTNEIDGVAIDGFILDMGMRNIYSPDKGKPRGVETGRLLLPPEKADGDTMTVVERCLYIAAGNKGGDITINNNVFLNSTKPAIHGGISTGSITITNNVFVSNRVAAIEVWGTISKDMTSAEIAYNTILFSWSQLDDFQEMGYGIRIVNNMRYNIHNNIVGLSTLAGLHNTRSSNDRATTLDNNILFLNKRADLEYYRGPGVILNFSVSDLEDLEFASSIGNQSNIPADYPVDKAYLEGFLNTLYTGIDDLKPGSQASQMRKLFGLSNPGSTSASMFCNRYSWKKSLELFGAINNMGAQTGKWPIVKIQKYRNIFPDFWSRLPLTVGF